MHIITQRQAQTCLDLTVGRAGLQMLEAVVEEFGLGSASPLGMPWDFHEKCCRDMEVSGRNLGLWSGEIRGD